MKSGRWLWAGHVACIHGSYKIRTHNFTRKPEETRPLWITHIYMAGYVKMDLKIIVADWIHMAQVRDQWRADVCTVVNLQLR
jgi:hypothetical protein